MKTIINLRRIVLALFCVSLMATTACTRQVGCGTWGKTYSYKPSNHQYASYGHFNRH